MKWLLIVSNICLAQCPTVDSNGICVLPLTTIQNNLLGPLTPINTNPWIFGDLAEVGIINNMVPAALAEIPTLSTQLCGTIAFSGFGGTVTTTCDLRTPLMGQGYVTFAWDSSDGPGTGRAICPISSVTINSIICSTNVFAGPFSGIRAYLMPPADTHGWTFLAWTQGNPTVSWGYYDAGMGIYRMSYRKNDSTYLSYARQYADIQWQWLLDHGYNYPSPRAASMISQFYRATEGHSERFPGLYQEINVLIPAWATNTDLRESGYVFWFIALGAKTDPDSTRHAQYCSWLNTYTPHWTSTQNADGSWSENEFQLNISYVSAPKSFTPPIQFVGAPWRQAINVKSLEAAYESLNDTSAQGCNNPSLASTLLTSITNAVTWQNNYGRNTIDRGVYYEVNSQSNDQITTSRSGTISVSLGSTVVLGVGTSFLSYCSTDPFIGIISSRTVYKMTCSDDTHATLTVNFGLYGESSNISGSTFATAPLASTTCHSNATQCYDGNGDRNLTRTICDGIAWLYQTTLNSTYKTWTDECLSASLGGPTAGLTTAATIGSMTLPCSGTNCDGLVTDTVASAPLCGSNPCVNGSYLYSNLGKNFGEAFGAPSIDNALARRLYSSAAPLKCNLVSGLTPPNVTDIALQTSMALGVVNCTNNLKQSGNCNIVDVQRVTSAALGMACKVGP